VKVWVGPHLGMTEEEVLEAHTDHEEWLREQTKGGRTGKYKGRTRDFPSPTARDDLREASSFTTPNSDIPFM